MVDYGWPITSLLSLINEDNELPLLPTNYGAPQLVLSAGRLTDRVCVCVGGGGVGGVGGGVGGICVCVGVCVSVFEGGHCIYKDLIALGLFL